MSQHKTKDSKNAQVVCSLVGISQPIGRGLWSQVKWVRFTSLYWLGTSQYGVWSLSLPNSASLGEFKTQGCGLSCDRLERKFMRSQNRSRREVYPYSYVASYCFHFFFCLPSISLSPSSFLSFNVILCSFLFSDLYFTFYFFFMTFFFIFTGHGQCQLFTS